MAAFCITAVCVFIVTDSGQRRLNLLLDMGDKYLSELDYEPTVATYQAAIAIDLKCENVYLGLADIYVAMGDLDAALEILKTGHELPASGSIAATMNEINAFLVQNQESSDGLTESEDSSQDDNNENMEVENI